MTTTAEETAATIQCYGEYEKSALECVGGLGADGVKYAPCALRGSCMNVAYGYKASALRPETTLVRNTTPSQAAAARSAYANFGAPPSNARPITPPAPGALPVTPAQPAPVPSQGKPPRQPVAGGPAPAQGAMVQAGQGTPVYYQAVTQQVIGVLPVEEPTHHSKPKRLAAEMTRAGLVAMGQQFASFVAKVPFLPDE